MRNPTPIRSASGRPPLPSDTDDRTLVDRCLAGDGAAWDLLAARFSGLVYFAILRTLRGRGGRLSVPDDLVGEVHDAVFLALMEGGGWRLGQWRGRSKLSHWIKVVAVRRTIDFVRSRRVEASLDEPGGVGAFALEAARDPGPDPEESALRAERMRVLSRVVDGLAAEDRRLLVLMFVEGRCGEDVARELSTTVGAVYTRKNRLRRRLTLLLAPHAEVLGGPRAA